MSNDEPIYLAQQYLAQHSQKQARGVGRVARGARAWSVRRGAWGLGRGVQATVWCVGFGMYNVEGGAWGTACEAQDMGCGAQGCMELQICSSRTKDCQESAGGVCFFVASQNP